MTFTGTSNDPFLPSIGQEAYIQPHFGEVFGQDTPDQPVFTSTNSVLLDDLESTLVDGSFSRATSPAPSIVTTPDFFRYDFVQQTSAYPHSGVGIRHPCPLEQQSYQAYIQPSFNHQPKPIRTHHNVTFHLHSLSEQDYTRRRSLSHSDVDRIAAPPNPTFVRLQSHSPRARSTAPEEQRRSGFLSKHVKSTSRGRPLKNTVQYILPASPLVGSMLPTLTGTPIGTPLEEPMGRKRSRGYNVPPFEYKDPLVRHITDPIQLAHSRRIIEIGAMAVRNQQKLDPRLDEEGLLSTHERIMKKLDDVERHLQQDTVGNQDALRGCATIREALTRTSESGDTVIKIECDDENTDKDELDAPSKMMSVEEIGLSGEYLEKGDLMGLLMKENRQPTKD